MTYRILFFVVDRANYGRLFPVIKRFQDDKRFITESCFLANAVLSECGDIVSQAAKDGVDVTHKLFTSVKGSTHNTMVMTISCVLSQVSLLLEEVIPDMVILIGDRYEALGCAIAASYKNIYVAHFQGGELSGTIDETTRHVITKMSHLHFPATEASAKIIKRMGEHPSVVHPIGCPISDFIASLSESAFNPNRFESYFSEKFIRELDRGFVLASMHPVTTNPGESAQITKLVQDVLRDLGYPVIWILPNIDPGANEILKNLGSWTGVYYIKNIMPLDYQYLLFHASVALGNSSSYIRDSSIHGTPVVSVGTRQQNRESSNNVISTMKPDKASLRNLILKQIRHGRYLPSILYGKGEVSAKAADLVYDFLVDPPSHQKTWYA
jgi:UDP-hydrolysing UDP-N-acetyl-D-glucosamine 2-epimerase